MKISTPSVLLVIPCYHESGRLGAYLSTLAEPLALIGGVRVLIVDDGSDDEEVALFKKLLAPFLERWSFIDVLFLPKNLGKGGAVYAGWNSATRSSKSEILPDWFGFVDADGSCSAGEVIRLIELARARGVSGGALFASRVLMLGRSVRRLWQRHLMGRVFATITSELLDIPVYDSQCGLKLLPRVAFDKVRDRLTVRGFAFDVELLVALLDSGCAVTEVPIDWHEVGEGKVRVLRDSWQMLRDVWRIRNSQTPEN